MHLTLSPCVEWLWARTKTGYGALRHEGKVVRAHRLTYCQANNLNLSEIELQHIRHKCDNPGCVNPDHLELGSNMDNVKDKMSRGRQPKGSIHSNSRLTEAQVKNVKFSTEKGSTLAKIYGVSQVTISQIRNGLRWRHV